MYSESPDVLQKRFKEAVESKEAEIAAENLPVAQLRKKLALALARQQFDYEYICELHDDQSEDSSNYLKTVKPLVTTVRDLIGTVEWHMDEVERFRRKSVEVARLGGSGRSAKFKKLQLETIRLFESSSWHSAPKAALEITPAIVAMSKNGNGDLSPTTTKPLEWIRAYIKGKKVA